MSEGMPTEKPWRKRAFWVRCMGGALAGFVGGLVIAVLDRVMNKHSVLWLNAVLATGIGLEAGLLVAMAQFASAVPRYRRILTVACGAALAACYYGLYADFPAALFRDRAWAMELMTNLFAAMFEEMGHATEAARLRRALSAWTITEVFTLGVVVAAALASIGHARRLREKLKSYALGLAGALLVRAALPPLLLLWPSFRAVRFGLTGWRWLAFAAWVMLVDAGQHLCAARQQARSPGAPPPGS